MEPICLINKTDAEISLAEAVSASTIELNSSDQSSLVGSEASSAYAAIWQYDVEEGTRKMVKMPVYQKQT